ncbi:MAG TPA: biotin--[acetyl-CoA-carboxylase] ligase [Limnochordia bacterium]
MQAVPVESTQWYYTPAEKACKRGALGAARRRLYGGKEAGEVGIRAQEILDMLRESEEPVSGEGIAARLRISRAAVWKSIDRLRREGYAIEGIPRRGYRLAAEPERLTAGAIRARLDVRRIGAAIEWYDEVGSTNDLAWERLEGGAPFGTVVGAERQTRGRGRRGRRWVSPRGRGLWFSILTAPPGDPTDAPLLTLWAAVAVAEGITRTTGLDAKIKWPNDILVSGRKVCGILAETRAELGRVTAAVVGIGVNVSLAEREFPREARATAASLCALAGRSIGRLELLVSVLQALDRWYARWESEGGAAVLERARSACLTLGRPVRVHEPAGDWDGEAVDLAPDGALLVRTPGGVRPVYASEVSVRHADAQPASRGPLP